MSKKIRIIDTTLRDGMHAVSHRFTLEDMMAIASAQEAAGIDTIEVSHGDGLGGSSFQYGFTAFREEEYLEAVSSVLKKTKLAVLLLPGIGTQQELKMSARYGVKMARVGTHVTEADIGEQHIKMAKDLGMEAIGFLMMAHMVPPEKVAEQAGVFASYGADAVYVTDSAGALLPSGVTERILAVKQSIGDIPVGFHGHNNLDLAIGNTLAAVDAGATYIDGTLRGLGAGAGNSATEVLTAVFNKLGLETGIDLYKVMDAAEKVVAPRMRRPQLVDTAALSIGYAGVYGSFLLHTFRASEKFGVDPRDILIELGKRKTVGGQEDMIVDVAAELSSQKKKYLNGKGK